MIPMWCVVKDREAHALEVMAFIRVPSDPNEVIYRQGLLCSECNQIHYVTVREERING